MLGVLVQKGHHDILLLHNIYDIYIHPILNLKTSDKWYEEKCVNLADIEKVKDISANTSQRRNLRRHSHHKLFRLFKFCFLKIVQGCQISKVLASFSAQRSQSRQPVVRIFPPDDLRGVQIQQSRADQTKYISRINLTAPLRSLLAGAGWKQLKLL